MNQIKQPCLKCKQQDYHSFLIIHNYRICEQCYSDWETFLNSRIEIAYEDFFSEW